jgi:hypothetical protein
LMKLPAGPGAPAADAADALAEATAACSAVATITSEIGVGGSVAGRRLRGRLLAGLAAPSSARLEAIAPVGQPIFIFVATGDAATLLFPGEDRVLQHARPAEVLEAIAGVPLDPVELRRTLTGCAEPATGSGRQFGNDWRAVNAGTSELYLRRHPGNARWELVAAVHRPPTGAAWRAEFGDFQDGLPRSVRLTSAPANRFDLRLTLSQIELNTPLPPDVFRVEIPPGAEPITIEELRRSGPFATLNSQLSSLKLQVFQLSDAVRKAP